VENTQSSYVTAASLSLGPPARPRLDAALLLAPLLLAIVLLQLGLSTDNDAWWHLRTGRLIAESGVVPRADPFSHTRLGQPWVSHEWLSALMMHLVQARLGYVGLAVLFGVVSAAAWLLVYTTLRERGVDEVLALILVLWGAQMDIPDMGVKPRQLTLLLAALFAWLLTRYRGGSRRALWPLPALMALWVNLHAGYLIGLVLIALTIVGEGLARVLRQPGAPLRPLLLAAGLSLLATVFGPHGPEALLYPFTYARPGNAALQYIQEWQSPNFRRPDNLLFAVSLLLAAVLGLRWRPLGPSDVLSFLCLALMALVSVRHISLYAVVAMPLLGARLQAELPALGRTLAAWRWRRLPLMSWLLLALVVAHLGATLNQRGFLQLGHEPAAAEYPAGGAAYLREHGVVGRLYNDYAWGGYLTYELFPRELVFIDGRTDVFDGQAIDDYLRVGELLPGWRDLLERYGVGTALVQRDSRLAAALGDDSAWREVYAGPIERIFVRRDGTSLE
jgi:hypothetical protein